MQGLMVQGGGDPHVSDEFRKPTKVVHLRNLPFEVTIEEIKEMCAPWGQVMAVKDKVGANKNQAFVEFGSIEQAVGIVSHYQSAVEPAQLRGRPTWLSFSGRDRLTNLAPASDEPSPVLQVSVLNIAPELLQAVNLDLLNLVFSPFGFVKKLVTYHKPEGGIVAWVQFPDPGVASAAKETLQATLVPPHLLSNHPSPPLLELAFCASTDLTINNQSPFTRDFSDPSLPWGEPDMALITAMLPGEGPSGPSNVLSVNFEQMTYPVALDGLHTIFSTYGFVQKILVFERDGKTVALVQYSDVRTADMAKVALEGHAMYDGGHNIMHCTYSKHRNLTIRAGERSKDYTLPVAPQAPAPLPQPVLAAPQGYGAAAMHHRSSGPAMIGGRRVDPHTHVTGEDYVRAHERLLEQYGVQTKRSMGPPMGGGYGPPGGYGGGYTAAAPAAAYGPPGGFGGYGAPPPQQYGYGAPQAPQYGAPPQQPYGYGGGY